MSAYFWQTDVRFGHVHKLKKQFLSILGEIEKERVTGYNPYKMAMEKLPLEVEALQNGPGVFLEHECKC